MGSRPSRTCCMTASEAAAQDAEAPGPPAAPGAGHSRHLAHPAQRGRMRQLMPQACWPHGSGGQRQPRRQWEPCNAHKRGSIAHRWRQCHSCAVPALACGQPPPPPGCNPKLGNGACDMGCHAGQQHLCEVIAHTPPDPRDCNGTPDMPCVEPNVSLFDGRRHAGPSATAHRQAVRCSPLDAHGACWLPGAHPMSVSIAVKMCCRCSGSMPPSHCSRPNGATCSPEGQLLAAAPRGFPLLVPAELLGSAAGCTARCTAGRMALLTACMLRASNASAPAGHRSCPA